MALGPGNKCRDDSFGYGKGPLAMAHILVGYELGGGHGHVHRLMPLVRALEQRGHRVTFFLRNIRENAGLLSRERRAVLPVPDRVARIPGAPVRAPDVERAVSGEGV